MSTTFRERSDRGAVAVMVAILSVLLLTVGALSVDLGNAWARKRSAQKQVDVAAMAGAAMLPAKSSADRTAVAQAVATSMNNASNAVGGQQDAAFSASQFLDSELGNGEITFQDNNGNTCAVTGLCTQITVTSPRARVEFGLGRIVSDGVDVEQTAVAKIFSEVPDGSHTLPFWLPNGCAFGAAEGDTSGGGNGGGGGNPIVANGFVATAPAGAVASAAPEAAATSPAVGATAAASAPQSVVVVSPVGSHSLGPSTANYTVGVGSTTDITNYVVSNVPSNTDRASIRFISPDNSTFVDYAVNEQNPRGTLIVPTFTVGPAVSNTSGVWTVYALIKPNGNQPVQYSTTHLTFTVGNPSVSTTLTSSTTTTSSDTTSTSTSGDGGPSSTTTTTEQTITATPTGNAVGCVGQNRGNFGQLDSPRRGISNIQQALGPNIALGLDHSIVQFLDLPPGTINCDDVPADRQDEVSEDDAPPQNGRNCIQGATGNDGPKMLEGLITGSTGNPSFKGRLDVTGGPNRNTSSLCTGGRTNVARNGVTINNDVLSCYLRNGTTLRDIAQPTGVSQSMVDPSIVNSPRFVWLPVVYAQTRDEHGWQPIYTFTAAFITDERWDFDANTPVNATSDNGIVINGNGNSVEKLTVFTFNSRVLPTNSQSPNVAYNEQIGRPVPRLVG
ncbi:hypothetical protein [Nocardioides taihuensis]|uniref:Flp pilus-assembly TadG-like N-terminal domain-containing protein n=1 Tax=Nocardioides taihuensis TaxID=1835606 RepID=A0ABW0BPF0_9ACTN